ncbi:hypothetical protein VTK56DRAFT_4681 [Thermocarpiscus australiensis]
MGRGTRASAGKKAASVGAGAASGSAAPVLQVIVLGSGGGPLESNVTAFLVRSLASGWAKGSVVAVDAGVHLSSVVRILEQTQPANLGKPGGPTLPHTLTAGPFAGVEIPSARAVLNAAHIHSNLIDTYLITHPHLDHIAGLIINTAGLPGARLKKIAGLPSTIDALKTHIFNNVIWPNLSDENNGAGLVTYMRLVEGGSPALGEGEGRGYLEICGGLAVKIWSVSHGHCIERHSHRGSSSTRHASFDASSTGGPGTGVGLGAQAMPSYTQAHQTSIPTNLGASLQQQQERLQADPTSRRPSASGGGQGMEESVCVYESSAFFIRDVATGREVLMFGDVEPDRISLSPRNRHVWREAAPKIAAGKLAAIFIECSYDDSQAVDRLFGHLTPQYLAEEMTSLAEEVVIARGDVTQGTETGHSGHASGNDKKRKGDGDGGLPPKRTSTPHTPRSDAPAFPKTVSVEEYVSSGSVLASVSGEPGKPLPLPMCPPGGATSPQLCTLAAGAGAEAGVSRPPDPRPEREQVQEPEQHLEMSGQASEYPEPTIQLNTGASTSAPTVLAYQPRRIPAEKLRNALKGLKVVVIHVKQKMCEGPEPGDVILEQLLGREREAKLGCEYIISRFGQHFFF